MRNTLIIPLLLLTCTPALGQTTQPAGSDWDALVRQFADALVAGDKPKATALIADRPAVKPFSADDPDAADRLFARTVKGTIIAAHGYQHPPLAMAADLAADFKAAHALPDDLRRKMIPEDDDQMKRANATAIQWVTDVLRPDDQQPVGIIVLWCDDPAAPRLIPGLPSAPQLVFLLIKAPPAPKEQLRITHITYGDPLKR